MYIPNVGEKEGLKAQLQLNAVQLMLYKNFVIPDGNTTIDTLEEMPTGGGRGYAPVELAPKVVEDALTSGAWFVNTNTSGKGQGQYGATPLQWIMTAQEVTDANTVQGVAGFCWILPFVAGSIPVKVGDVLKGLTSGAKAIVTGVMVQSGSWALGTAAGYLNVMTKTGTFQNDENLRLAGTIATLQINNGGSGYAVGDTVQPDQAGAEGAKIVVAAIGAAGVVTALVLVEGGIGFTVAAGLATEALSGGGASLTIDVLTLSAVVMAVSNTGTVNAGDADKRLLFIEAQTTPTLVNAVGLPFNCTPIRTEQSAT